MIGRIIVVGASAGGVESLKAFVSSLAADLAAAVFVVLHIRPNVVSNLPQILSRSGPLKAAQAEDNDVIRPGRIYVAPPDYHLLVDAKRMAVKKGPKENRFRPSVDALFRSAAFSHRANVIGVVLSGALDDGTSGLWTIKRFGGTTIVQDPDEASFDSMPLSALEQVDIDHTAKAKDMGPLITRLLEAEVKKPGDPPKEIVELAGLETKVATSTNAFELGVMERGRLSPFTCPECHGALVKLKEGPISRFRCHTGHGFSASSLLAGITEFIEPTLWEATRALEECVMLLDQMADDYAKAGRSEDAERFTRKARQTEERAHALQKITISHEHLSQDALVDK
jgi:two-component system chemotaxis response regulator CheB